MTDSRTSFTSLALRSIMERLPSDGSAQVLDLGRASGANIEFYSKFARHIYVEDLFWTVRGERSSEPITVDALRERLGSVSSDARLDLICCWDTLNYLSPNEAAEFAAFLRPLTHAGTMLYAVMHTRPKMPMEPFIFKIQPECRIIYERSVLGNTEAPCYTKRHIERMLAGFKRSRSVLLQSGMEEQLFFASPRPEASEKIGASVVAEAPARPT